VMDAAVKEHQHVIRKTMQRHYGYESATEGDSFIIAFHTPRDALHFALEMQVCCLPIAMSCFVLF
jgi:class 3 adenylate cyclase